LLAPFFSFSQTTYLPQGDKAAILLERMEIKGQNDSLLNFSKTRPYSRRSVVYAAGILSNTMQLSKVDNYNLNSLYKNNMSGLMMLQQFRVKNRYLKIFITHRPIYTKYM
jgi:hypothetical protein